MSRFFVPIQASLGCISDIRLHKTINQGFSSLFDPQIPFFATPTHTEEEEEELA